MTVLELMLRGGIADAGAATGLQGAAGHIRC